MLDKYTLLYYATQNTMRTPTYAAQGPAQTLTCPQPLYVVLNCTDFKQNINCRRYEWAKMQGGVAREDKNR